MAPEATYPVVQVINGDEEDIGAFCPREARPADECGSEESERGGKSEKMHLEYGNRIPVTGPAVPCSDSGRLAPDWGYDVIREDEISDPSFPSRSLPRGE